MPTSGVGEHEYQVFLQQREEFERERKKLGDERLKPSPTINKKLQELGTSPLDKNPSLLELLKRPEIRYNDLVELSGASPGVSRRVAEQIEIQIKYDGYIQRQMEQIKKFQHMEQRVISINSYIPSVKRRMSSMSS